MKPKFSIILPNYNHARFLQQRIESILDQTNRDWELIILDDNSTDRSLDVINRYRNHPQVSHVIINNENSGSTFIQWQRGISLAKGEYIWIAESDDMASEKFLETFTEILDQDKNIEIAFCSSDIIDERGDLINRDIDIKTKNDFREYSIFNSRTFINKHMLFNNQMYNASGIVFKKNLWDRIDKGFISLKLCGDWICWLSMLSKTENVIWVQSKLNKFRQHQNKVTTKSVNNGLIYFERMDVLRYLINNCNISTIIKRAIICHNNHLIKKSDLNYKLKQDILEYWRNNFHMHITDYIAFCLTKLCL